MNRRLEPRSLTDLCQSQPRIGHALTVLYDHMEVDHPSRAELFRLARVLRSLTEEATARANAPLAPP